MPSSLPKNPHGVYLQKQLTTKIQQVRQLVQSGEEISYCDLHYMVNEKQLRPNLIQLFLMDIHQDRLESINQNWQNLLQDSQILSDAETIKKKAVQQSWKQQNVDEKAQVSKQKLFDRYHNGIETKQDRLRRVKHLRDEMSIVQNQINMASKQDQAVQLTKKYKELKRQHVYWTNQKRQLRALRREKTVNERSWSKDEDSLKELMEKMNGLVKAQQRQGLVQQLQSISTTQAKSGHSKQRLKLLQQLFDKYAKTEGSGRQSMLFDSKREQMENITLEKYIKLTLDCELDQGLSLDERVKLFKQAVGCRRQASFHQFMNILKGLCQYQCQKLNINFTSKELQTFLEKILKKQRDNQKTARSADKSGLKSIPSYQFKVKAHSGKSKEDLVEELKLRKQGRLLAKESKRKQQKDRSMLRSVGDSSELRSRMHTDITDTRISRNTYKTIDSNIYPISLEKSGIAPASHQSIHPTYASIFQKRRHQEQGNRSRRTYIDSTPAEDQSKKSRQVPSSLPMLKEKRTPYPIQADSQDEQKRELFNMLVSEDDDPFLKKHLTGNRMSTGNSPFLGKSKFNHMHF